MTAAQGPRPFPLSPSLALYSARVLRLLLMVAGVLGVLRLGGWVGLGLASLNHQVAVGGNTFTTRSLGAPSNLLAHAAGGDVLLSWTAGANGAGYALSRVANANSSDCSAAVFAPLATPGGASYIDAGRDSPPGSWECYQVATASGGWTSPGPNPVAAVQLGFVASSVQFINTGNANGCGAAGVADLLDCGDQIIIGFNQPVAGASGPSAADTVCADSAGHTIRLGSAITSGACSPTEAVTVGVLSGSAVDGCDCRYSAGYAWDAGGRTLTITLGTRTDGAVDATLGGSLWTFNPTTDTAKLKSATGNFHVCDYNTGGANCWPATQ